MSCPKHIHIDCWYTNSNFVLASEFRNPSYTEFFSCSSDHSQPFNWIQHTAHNLGRLLHLVLERENKLPMKIF